MGLLVGGKATAGVLSLAYMVLVARALGPAEYGVLILVHTYTMTVGGIVSFPGWHAVVRYGAEAVAADDVPRMMRLLRFTATLELGVGVAAIVAAMALAPWIGPRLGWSDQALAFAVPYSFAVLASVRSTPAGLLQLMGRFGWLGLHNIVAPLVRLLGAAAVVLSHSGLKGFLVVWLSAALAEWLSLWLLGWLALRTHGHSTLMSVSLDGIHAENPGLWRFMLAANADIAFSELAGRLAPLTIGWVLGPAAAGLYALAQRATVILVQPAQILGQAAFAELARLVAGGGSPPAVRHALARTGAIALSVSVPIVALMVLFSGQLIRALGGAAYASAATIMIWLVAARLLLMVAPPISAALTAMGQPGLSVRANLFSSLGLLPLLPLLLWQFEVAGAGLHALLQAFMASAMLVLFVLRITRPLAAPV
ncbi:MAG: lipopolysaccharide biosynthesis protein [Xanthomonadaceae bacterium]|nr:lipopolysaccharide biosynthesis protein [Xanthomonadaceae bacterium]